MIVMAVAVGEVVVHYTGAISSISRRSDQDQRYSITSGGSKHSSQVEGIAGL